MSFPPWSVRYGGDVIWTEFVIIFLPDHLNISELLAILLTWSSSTREEGVITISQVLSQSFPEMQEMSMTLSIKPVIFFPHTLRVLVSLEFLIFWIQNAMSLDHSLAAPLIAVETALSLAWYENKSKNSYALSCTNLIFFVRGSTIILISPIKSESIIPGTILIPSIADELWPMISPSFPSGEVHRL